MLSLESLTIMDCEEFENIVVDNGDRSSTGVNIVFPKLKELIVVRCEKLEYIFGHINNASDIQNYLHLPALISLKLLSLPSFIGMGTKNYHTMLSHLEEITLKECPKDLSGNDLEPPHLALQELTATNSKFQCIFYLDEINGQQRNLGLQVIELKNLAQMTYLFVGPRNCFSLQNLLKIKIVQCRKLEIIFSTCVLKCLPQLINLIIDECDELEYIIEEDDDHVENKEISNDDMSSIRTCFPKLETLVVKKCNKLNYVFPASMCTELPELWFLMIQEACKLQKIFGGSEENDQKVRIPNLHIVVLVELPSFFQGIQFQPVKHRLVHNCQKLSMTSTSTSTDVFSTLESICIEDYLSGYDLERYMWSVSQQIVEEHSKSKDTSGGNQIGTEIQSSTSRNEIDSGLEIPPIAILPTSSEELMNPKHSVAEINTTAKPSHENNGIKLSVEDGITSANAKTITSSTNSKSANSLGPSPTATSSLEHDDGQIVVASPPIAITKPLTTQCVDVKNTKDTSKANDDQVSLNDDSAMKANLTIEHQTSLMLPKGDPSQIDGKVEDGDDQIAMTSFSNATSETNNQASRNDDALKKVSSNVKDQFHKNNEEIVSKSPVPSQFPLVPSKGYPSQKVEDASSSLLVTRELELLVSKKHLDYENLALLNDFLINHPSVLLKDTSLSNKYKGYAYNCLAELLKFLKTHSVLEVSGSCQTEFVELLQAARSFSFDKDWLDGVERRALFLEIQVSQDALQKLSESKQKVTKDVEVLRLKIDILNQHVEDLKHQLTSSESLLESILKQEAVLSAPIGY